ncbi:MAG: pyridoxamine 5'-phosphate oxidase [Pseudomonadota bacterium]
MSSAYDSFRREFTAGGLSLDVLDEDPIAQFETWLKQAVDAGLKDPTAMVLATIDDKGLPWQRTVLLKGVSNEGFVFYTNYTSNKAQAMAAHPRVSLLFPWNELDRQVIVGGEVEKISPSESASYFTTRPRESQIAAWASRQSQPIATRAVLEQQANALRDKFGEGEIPVPDFWGGYRVIPEKIEFWQGREHRLHDRFVYQLANRTRWSIEQLQP